MGIFKDLARGIGAFIWGLAWLRRHPGRAGLLVLPWLAGILTFTSSLGWFLNHDTEVVGWFVAESHGGPGFLAWLGYHLLKILIYLSALILVAVVATLITSIVASPIYEMLSVAVEREEQTDEPPSLKLVALIRVALTEVKKVILVLSISIAFLLIPGVNILATLVTAFLLGWDAFDYPLARRGWTLRERRQLALQEFWAILGLGLWMIIPFAQVLTIPLAITGGSKLSLDALKRRRGGEP